MNKRIAKNTMMLYIRMLFTMTVSLYTSRVVLNTLGIEDFGIYNVIGGVVVIMSVLNVSMSIAVQRFLSFELGQKNEFHLKKIFNISLYTHAAITVIVLILAETAGLWFVNTQLNIPETRMYAVKWVYQFSVFSCMLTILQVPYIAVIISNEKMNIYAYLGIIEVALKLLIVYILLIGNIDKLILYGVLTFGVSLLIMIIIVYYCNRKFLETRFLRIWDGNLFKKILSFAGWSLFSELAWVFVLQGVNIVMNIFFGPSINAAKAISDQVNGAINRFCVNFQTAVKPQVIKLYAANELQEMFNLLFKGTRFSYYLLFILSLPILLETEFLLKIWLVHVPDYTIIFCRFAIINSLIDVNSSLLSTVVRASGSIRKYETIISAILISNFPISYLILKLGGNPELTFCVYGFISIFLLFTRLYLIKQIINFSIKKFMKEVVSNVLLFTIVAMVVPVIYHFHFNFGIYRFIISTIISALSVALTLYFLGLKNSERVVINTYIKKIGNRKMVDVKK